jgi:hypothetical protein
VSNFRTNVKNYLAQDIAGLEARLTTYFSNAAAHVSNYFDNLGSSMGGSTIGSQQSNGGDLQQLYTNPVGQAGGAQPGAYAQSQSIPCKMKDNARSASKSSDFPSSVSGFLSTFNDVLNNKIPTKLNNAGYLKQAEQAAKGIPNAFSGLFLIQALPLSTLSEICSRSRVILLPSS